MSGSGACRDDLDRGLNSDVSDEPKPTTPSHSSVVGSGDSSLTLAEIRERQRNRKTSKWDSHGRSFITDIDTLLSIIDSLQTVNAELKMIIDVGTGDDPGTALMRARKYIARAVDTERERCAKIAETQWAMVSVGKVSIESQAEYERCAIAAAIRATTQPENDRQTTTEEKHSPASKPKSSESESTLVTVDEAEAERIRIVAYLSYDTTYSDNFCLRCSHDPSNCECHNPVYMSSDWTPSDELKALKVALFQEVPASAYRAGRGHPQLCPSCGGSWRHNKGCIATELSVHQPDVQAADVGKVKNVMGMAMIASDLKVLELEFNNLLLDIYDLSIANAPVSPSDCRNIADSIGNHVGECRKIAGRIALIAASPVQVSKEQDNAKS